MKYKIKKYIYKSVQISDLASKLLNEIKDTHKPFFKFFSKKTPAIPTYDFNMIRLLMPLIETAAKIEFNGDVSLLLKKLNIPEAEIAWVMYRHGLLHSIRPFPVTVKGKEMTWAIPQHKCNHKVIGNSIRIYPPKLFDDLKKYLENVKNKHGNIRIQTGVEVKLR